MLLLILSVLEDDQRNLVEKIYKENYQYFLKVAMQITGSTADAEEAVSSALLKISLNILKISHLTCPEMKAFCVTIVKNCSYDVLRKSSRIIPDSDEALSKMDSSIQGPEHQMLDKEKRKALLKMLEVLSSDEKVLLELRYTYEMKYSEIARMLSISEEAAKKKGQRLIGKLRKQYEENSDEYDF